MPRFEGWSCTVCGQRYDTESEAAACEATPDQLAELPVGMLFNDAGAPKGFYAGITFAIAVRWRERHMHTSEYVLWAARDNGAGDSLGRERCGGGFNMPQPGDVPDPGHPTFVRLVRWLESQHIPVTCWDGARAVPLAEFLATHPGRTYTPDNPAPRGRR